MLDSPYFNPIRYFVKNQENKVKQKGSTVTDSPIGVGMLYFLAGKIQESL
jgi:hypothetical protein